MKTLQETAILTVLKFGIPFTETLPPLLQIAVNAVDRRLRRSCTGTDYYEHYRVQEWRLNLNISWNHGTWTFVQRGFYEDDNYDQRTVHIRAGRESFMSWVWGRVFGLLDENNFLVTDIQLEPSRSQVVFHGYYYCRYSGKRRTFKSTFQFSATSFYVSVRAEEKFVNGTEAGFRESCFQKPDPTGWLQHWDDQIHDPPFIQSTLDYLTQEVWS